jgi:lipopolysaccharide/colanic/teichoic acid biosynthesis glycosyltransferase
MSELWWVLLGALLSLLLAEFTEMGPWLAERVIRRAVWPLPADQRERYLEEWLGELDAVPGKLTKLTFAVRVVIGAPVTGRTLHGLAPPTRYERFAKPALDRLAGALLLVALSPLLLVVTLVIWIRLGRPVLLREERMGQYGRSFALYRFRTVLPDRRSYDRPFVGPDRRRTGWHPDDPRHIPIGRMLRRYALDDLPQMFNVIKGDMSLVGPRPRSDPKMNSYKNLVRQRQQVRPGLTGPYQVTGGRKSGLLRMFGTEVRYAGRVTLRGDLMILLRTFHAVLRRRFRP